MPTRHWSDQLFGTAWDPLTGKSGFAARHGSMTSCQMGEEWLHPADFSHPEAHRPPVLGAGPEVNRCKTDVQDSPQPCTGRSNKYIMIQRNLTNLKQILANKKYHEMSFFPHTVKSWNTLPTTLLAGDSLKAFLAGVVNLLAVNTTCRTKFHSPTF